METVILAFLLMVLIVTAMAVGVIIKGKPIKGSCGGISSLGMGTACDICGGDATKCEKEQKKSGKEARSAEPKAAYYDASR